MAPGLSDIFVGAMESGTEGTLSKSEDDMKLCGAIDMLEERV